MAVLFLVDLWLRSERNVPKNPLHIEIYIYILRLVIGKFYTFEVQSSESQGGERKVRVQGVGMYAGFVPRC